MNPKLVLGFFMGLLFGKLVVDFSILMPVAIGLPFSFVTIFIGSVIIGLAISKIRFHGD